MINGMSILHKKGGLNLPYSGKFPRGKKFRGFRGLNKTTNVLPMNF